MPEVEFGELRVRGQVRNTATSENAALEHKNSLVAEVADECDVVLDDTDGNSTRRHLADNALHRFVGSTFNSRHGLIEQQAARVVHQRPCHAHQLLLAIGQIANGFLRRIAKSHAIERFAPFSRANRAAVRTLPGVRSTLVSRSPG